MILKQGEKYRIFYSEGNHNNKTVHIRAIVDNSQVVFKWWSRSKQRWIYKVEDMYYFKSLSRSGNIEIC
jgi:hypothetical protein